MMVSSAEITSPSATADVIFVNGTVITVNARDEVAEALAVAGSRILRVGTRASVEQTVGRDTRVVDLAGRALIPGLVDNHIHMTNSPQRSWLDCTFTACPTIDDLKRLIEARTREVPEGEWIFLRGYQATRLAERRDPTRHDLDPVSPSHPVGVCNREGMGWTFNTAGLRRLGIQDDTPDPPGGPMARDDQGRPLGPLFDSARAVYVRPNLPKTSVDDLVDGYRWVAARLNEHGVTTAFEAAVRNTIETVAWQRLQRQEPPSLRVVLGPYHGDGWDLKSTAGKIFESGFATRFGNEWLKLGSLQLGIDGGVVGQTAALYEPYSNDPTGTDFGSFRVSQEVANEFMVTAQQADWQVGLIAHGDRGIDRAFDAVVHQRRVAPGPDLRHRLEHAYMWGPAGLDRMGELGLIWNAQPMMMEVLGREGVYGQWGERARYSFPFKSLHDRGVMITGGSDWSVGPINPLIGIDIMVNHRFGPDQGGEVLNADERLTVLQAIRAYTYNAAYTCFEEQEQGSLEAGKRADLAVLSENILAVDPTRIRDIRVDQTYVDGRRVFERQAEAAETRSATALSA